MAEKVFGVWPKGGVSVGEALTCGRGRVHVAGERDREPEKSESLIIFKILI